MLFKLLETLGFKVHFSLSTNFLLLFSSLPPTSEPRVLAGFHKRTNKHYLVSSFIPHCHFGLSPVLYATKTKRKVITRNGSPKTKKLLPESGFPGIASSLVRIRTEIKATYDKVASQPCQLAGIQPHPQTFLLNQ